MLNYIGGVIVNISGKRIYKTLEKIAFTREAGTTAEKKAAEVICSEVSKLGLTANLESFEIDDAETSGELKVLSPYEKTYNVTAYKHAKPTPPEGITTEFIYVDSACESNYGQLKNHMVLFNEMNTSIQKLSEQGLDCILSMNGKGNINPENDDMYTNSFREEDCRNIIPALTIHTRDALEMVKNMASKVWFRLENRSYKATSQNITVTIKGTRFPEEIIAIGAHYDSVPVGHGASDNGGGSAIIMELLRYFTENPPSRTLRFIWFGSEEIGLFGSKAYLEAHKDELKAFRLMINVDVAGSVIGRNFVRATAEESVAHYIQFLADEVGYIADIKQGLMGSDSTPFADKKVPSVGFGRGSNYNLEFAHSSHDTMEYISEKALEDTAEFILTFAKHMIEAANFPVPNTIPDNIVERINKMLGK